MEKENFEQNFISLEEQFKNREIIKAGKDEFKMVDVRPETEKTDVPILIAPGWNATPNTFKKNILNLAKLDRRVLCVDSPHGIEAEKNEKYPYVELRKINAIKKALEQKNIEKIDAIGHSEAGIYLSIAATLYPDKFRNIVFVNPAGMIGDDNIVRLSVDFIKDLISQWTKSKNTKTSLNALVESGKSIISDPIKSIQQILAISKIQIPELLRDLKGKGVGISIIHSIDDKVFPMEKMQKMAEKNNIDGFYSTKGTHNELFLDPEKYSKLIDKILSDLQSRKK